MTDHSTPDVQALTELISSGNWRTLATTPNVFMCSRQFPDGTFDTLATQGENEAVAERTDALNQLVWREAGPVSKVVDAVRLLPPPMAHDAPRTPLRNVSSPDRDV